LICCIDRSLSYGELQNSCQIRAIQPFSFLSLSTLCFGCCKMPTLNNDPIDKLSYVATETQASLEKSIRNAASNNTSDFDPLLEKRVLQKIDRWLVGFYSLVYVFRVIDSANYSNAAIINLEAGTGIKKQLGFTPSQWAWTLSIFSYSYLIFEPTNTILLKLFKPSRWMFILIMAWGVSACCSAAAMNFEGMMCVRFADSFPRCCIIMPSGTNPWKCLKESPSSTPWDKSAVHCQAYWPMLSPTW
jgi:hypothetical protein